MEKLKILFLCTGNSCRSQMAEAFAKSLKKQEIEAYSAGTNPTGINPNVVKVMKEVGIDVSGYSSKHLDQVKSIRFDYVITLCGSAQETCPVFPGSKVIHRGFEDPPTLAKDTRTEEEKLQHYRRIRDQIRDFVLGLPGNITS